MVGSKNRDLRVIESDPTNGVQPPERGANKGKVYPYPGELLAVAACEDVPLAWRELHVIAAYTFMRPGELQVLEWSDVDLADRKIRVTKAWDYKNDRTKGTKTGETREIPIEPNLLPLLERMRERAKGNGLVAPQLAATNPDKLAILTRAHFAKAGCIRARLTAKSAAERHLVFRSWRDAGITWSIVRGDDVVRVQRRAGHRLIATTMRYVVEAENTGATFGVPFPQLPDCLLGIDSQPNAQPNEGGVNLQATGTYGESSTEGGTRTRCDSEGIEHSPVDVEESEERAPKMAADKSAMPGRLGSDLGSVDPVEAALVRALERAKSDATIAAIVRELTARRSGRTPS
jgi:hypothetical protein